MSREHEGSSRAALLNAFQWEPGSRITAQFLEGDPACGSG
jgi:hypothetical protein